MTLDALALVLRCPACRGPLAYEPVPQRDTAAGECGRLHCSCATYPVVDSIPILRRDVHHRSIADARVVADGESVEATLARVEAGDGLEALVRLLATPLCPWPLNQVGALRRASLWGPIRMAGLAVRRAEVRRMLRRRSTLTTQDWMSAFYWHAPVPYDPYNYFFFRFGQPRHLATLALAAALPADASPVLDLACGYGHLLHTLAAQGRAAVGVDQNVHQVWLARHRVAPGAAFVCADADAPLPFRDDAFAAALCCDAFHYFADKATAFGELARVSHGAVLLPTVGNGRVAPLEGNELTPEGYGAVFGDRPWRVCTEAALLAGYLDGQGPDLSASAPDPAVAAEKWLYYVIGDERLFRRHGPLATWPHAAGEVHVNPVYVRQGDRYRLRFPSPWYAFENRGMGDYLPATLALGTDAEADLLASAALVGLPQAYAGPRRPRALVANRGLARLRGRWVG